MVMRHWIEEFKAYSDASDVIGIILVAWLILAVIIRGGW